MNDTSNEASAGGKLANAQEKPGKAKKVLLTSVSSDAHTWNLVYMQLLLEQSGHEVVNLGACVPDEMIEQECLKGLTAGTDGSAPTETPYDYLIVSSVNGHGSIDGERLMKRLRSNPLLQTLPAVIGGKLTTAAGHDLAVESQKLVAAGFDAVSDDSSKCGAFSDRVKLALAGKASASFDEVLQVFQGALPAPAKSA
ncbi:hypothetical protein V8J88_15795 [Massilia sp. W12]|uniref:cobalamin B12-binding domain-containing protein n=1 Tax=Massilia sp. W12 TaxID=3126507 RepID=UPI0030CFD242